MNAVVDQLSLELASYDTDNEVYKRNQRSTDGLFSHNSCANTMARDIFVSFALLS